MRRIIPLHGGRVPSQLALFDEQNGNTGPRSFPRIFARLNTAFRTADALRVMPAHERLIALDNTGVVVRVIDGTESHLELDAALEALLNQPGAGIVLVIRQRLIAAHTQLVRQLSIERPASGIDVKALDQHMSHLLALVLHKAGAIEYAFTMSSDRRQSYDRWRPVFGRVTEASAGKVRSAMKSADAR